MLELLSEFGVNTAADRVGGVIAGVALGFGAQTLVRDTIGGLFIVLEGQFDVGDMVDLRRPRADRVGHGGALSTSA